MTIRSVSARIFTISENMETEKSSKVEKEEKQKGPKSSTMEKRLVTREQSNPMSVQSSEGSKVDGIRPCIQVEY